MCRLQRHSLQRIYVILPPSKCEVSPTNTRSVARLAFALRRTDQNDMFLTIVFAISKPWPLPPWHRSVSSVNIARRGVSLRNYALYLNKKKLDTYCWKDTARSEMNRETHSALLELVSRTVHG